MRRRLVDVPNSTPFFITAVCYKRKRLFSKPINIRFLIIHIKNERRKNYFKIYEYVLMPDHYHAIFEPGSVQTISTVMHRLHGSFARAFNKFRNSNGQVFKHRYYDIAIRDQRAYQNITEYIYNNPMKASLVDKPEDYPWSSARARLKGNPGLIPLDDPPF